MQVSAWVITQNCHSNWCKIGLGQDSLCCDSPCPTSDIEEMGGYSEVHDVMTEDLGKAEIPSASFARPQSLGVGFREVQD